MCDASDSCSRWRPVSSLHFHLARLRLVLASLCVLLPSTGAALAVSQPCISHDDPALPKFKAPVRIALGCELPGCCPGCNTRRDIVLRVALVAPRNISADIRIERPATRTATRSEEGTLEWSREHADVVRLTGTDEIALDGFEAEPVLPSILTARIMKVAGDVAGAPAGPNSLHITQELDGEVIRRVVLSMQPACAPSVHDKGDRLQVRPETAEGAAALVAWWSEEDPQCKQHWAIGPGNVLPIPAPQFAACRGSLAAFAKGAGAERFTDWPLGQPGGNAFLAQLPGTRELRIANWVAHNDEQKWARRLDTEVCVANAVLDENRAGVRLIRTKTDYARDEKVARKLRGTWCGSATDWDLLGPRDDKAVNVYRLNTNIARGQHCRDTNDVAISLCAASDVMLHELGHTLSLDDLRYGAPHSNVMYQGGFNRDRFTVGQLHRMNFNSVSVAQTLVSQAANEPKDCEGPLMGSDPCPAQTLDLATAPAVPSLSPRERLIESVFERLECVECDSFSDPLALDRAGVADWLRLIAVEGLAASRRAELIDFIDNQHALALAQPSCGPDQIESGAAYRARQIGLKELQYRFRALDVLQQLSSSKSKAVRDEAKRSLTFLRGAPGVGSLLQNKLDDPYRLICQ